MSESKLIGFRIQNNKLIEMLDHLRANGTTLVGEKTNFMDECIIRVDTIGIWSITIDVGLSIVSQAKINIEDDKEGKTETYGKGGIPIIIEKILKYTKRFANTDIIDVLYEKGIIIIKKTKDNIDVPVNVKAVIGTIRINNVRNDVLNNTLNIFRENKSEIHKKMIQFIKKYRSIYKLNKTKKTATLYNGMTLSNYVEISCNQIKDVIRDGELLNNRLYPFEIKNGVLNITAKSTLPGSNDRLSRDIYVKDCKLNDNFIVKYPSQLNAAINQTKGHIKLFFDKDMPLLVLRTNDLDHGLDLSYIVSPRLRNN